MKIMKFLQMVQTSYRDHGFDGASTISKEAVVRGWPRIELMPILPLALQVEITSNCNLSCVFCDRTHHMIGKGQNMDIEVFKATLKKFSSARQIHLQGWGEPLMHPHFFDFVRLAEPDKRFISTNTNMTIMTKRIAEAIFASHIHALRVSLDGASKEVYERLRPPASWERVLRNLELLLDVRRSIEQPVTEVSLVVICQQDSVHELPDLVSRTAALGLKTLRIQELRQFTEKGAPSEEVVESTKETCFQLAQEKEIELDWSFYSEWAGQVCSWPWSKTYVRADGKIHLCCEKVFAEDDVLGDVTKDTAQAIWNGERYREARRKLASGSYPASCCGCPIYHFPKEPQA